MDRLLHDLRAAARALRARPRYTALIIATLALAIGANTAIFSVVHAVLLRQLPYRDPEALALLQIHRSDGDLENFSVADLDDLRRDGRTLAGVAGYVGGSINLTSGGEPEQLRYVRAGAGFFETLGVEAQLGRTLAARDATGGGAKVAVLGDRLWHRRFGADPGIVGRSVVLNDQSYEVVGVLPRAFLFPEPGAELAIPVDLARDPRAAHREDGFVDAIGRLAPGVARVQAEAELTEIARRLQRDFPATNARKAGVVLQPLADSIVGNFRGLLGVLLAAVGLVLLIACANIASLLLSSGAGRRRELAIKAALGASRGRITRQLLLETAILAAAGGALGTWVGSWGVELLAAISPQQIPRLREAGVDLAVLGFTLAASLATAVLCGLWPAVAASRAAPAEALGDGRSSPASAALRARRVLVLGEVALALALLAVTGLMVRSFARLSRVQPGFEPRAALVLRLALPPRYRDRAALVDFQERVRARLLALPGVVAAGNIHALPLGRVVSTVDYTIEGQPPARPEDVPETYYRMVGPGYLRAMGITLVAGRDLQPTDGPAAPAVGLVSAHFAARSFGEGRALGRRLIVDDLGPEKRTVEIVGIVADVRQDSLEGKPTADLYVPLAQVPEQAARYAHNMYFVARTAGDPALLARPAVEALHGIDAMLPAASVQTLEELIAASVAPRRFNLQLISGFAAAALLLAALGIYALTASSVAQRRREMGIRLALGAEPGRLVRLMMRDGLRPVVLGLAAGLALALAAGRLATGLLFEIGAADPVTLAAVMAVLFAAALVAAWLAARRAATADPVSALRAERAEP